MMRSTQLLRRWIASQEPKQARLVTHDRGKDCERDGWIEMFGGGMADRQADGRSFLEERQTGHRDAKMHLAKEVVRNGGQARELIGRNGGRVEMGNATSVPMMVVTPHLRKVSMCEQNGECRM